MFQKNATLIVVLLVTVSFASFVVAGPGHDHAKTSAFQSVVNNYLAIQTALAADSIEGVAGFAKGISKSAQTLGKTFDANSAGIDKKDSAVLKKILPELINSADKMAKARDIKEARASFEHLSNNLIAYRELATGDKPNVAYCGMAKKSWIQDGKKIANPYYGSKMLRCGSIVNK